MDNISKSEIEKRRVFLRDVDALCRLHGYSISHEDHHGAFEIKPYDANLAC